MTVVTAVVGGMTELDFPRSVVNSDNVRGAVGTVVFTGAIGNFGNVPETVTLYMRATSGGAALASGSAVPVTKVVSPGDQIPVTISQAVLDTDPPGTIAAIAWLENAKGKIPGAEKTNINLGTIESAAVPTLTGTFTLSI